MARWGVSLLFATSAVGMKHFGHNNINRVDWDVVPPKALSEMTVDHAKALTRCAHLSAEHISHMPASVTRELDAQCWKSMSVSAFNGVTFEQAQHFTTAMVAQMTARQTAALSPSACGGFGSSEGFSKMTASVCNGLTAECLAAIPAAAHAHVTQQCFLPLQRTTPEGRTVQRQHEEEVRRAIAREEAARKATQGSGDGALLLFGAVGIAAVAMYGMMQQRAPTRYDTQQPLFSANRPRSYDGL